MTKASFQVITSRRVGLQILHSAGEILISDCQFSSSQGGFLVSGVLALDVTHGCESCIIPFSNMTYDFFSHCFSLVMERCTFQDISSIIGTPQNNYDVSRDNAVAVRMRFADNSVNNRILVNNSNFANIRNTEGSSVLVTLSGSARDNRITFQGCTFTGNMVHYGGGVASYFYSGPSNNALEIKDCDFNQNNAVLEGGGFFAVFLSSGSNNTVVLSDSRFLFNRAQYGGAVFMLNNPSWFEQQRAFNPMSSPLVEAEIRGCDFFANNVYVLTNGIVSVLRVQLNMSGSK